MVFKSTILAAIVLLATANAHMIMESPVPFSVDKIDNGPINDDQYPCKNNLGYTVSKMNNMAVGEKQTLSFKGSAVHGGGSCQLSVTTDTKPTNSSIFKVIKTMEGGCPGIEKAEKFDFELPASIPNGQATFAWTWFAKLSGGPEMYMNCAPIEVTGGASDKSAFDALPNMLKANLPSTAETCQQIPSTNLLIPNPGENLVSSGKAVPGKGGCGGSSGGSPPASPSSPAGQPSPPAGQPSASAPPSQPTPPAGGQSSASAPPSAPSPPPSNPGGVFAPGASAAPTPATSTTLVTVTGAPTPAKPTVPIGTGTPAQPTPPSTGGGSAPAAPGGSGSTCSTNGAVVCNGEKQFGLCNNGNVVWQEVASGTACVNGVISKRSMRVARPRYNRKA